MSGRTKWQLSASAVAAFGAKMMVAWATFEIAAGAVERAAILGVLGAGLFVAQRVTSSIARVGVECNLHAAAARALMASDVLRVPDDDLQLALFESNHHATAMIGGVLPMLAADTSASVVFVPLLIAVLPLRIVGIGCLASLVALAALMAMRGVSVRLQEQMFRSYQALTDAMLVGVEGRLEMVARGAESTYVATTNTVIENYARFANRAQSFGALLSRAPIAAALAVLIAAAALDPQSRESLSSTIAVRALTLAATLPALIGCLLGAHELRRARVRVSPLYRILSMPMRSELVRENALRVLLPSGVDIEKVSFRYEAGEAPILEDLSFEWPVGCILVLTGPNGSGKSTLLRLLIGLRPATLGSVRIDGKSLTTADLATMRRDVAFLPQRSYLGEPHRTVREAFEIMFSSVDDREIEAQLARVGVLGALTTHGLPPLDVRIGELSSGQRQRVALARVLLQDAKLVLLDEPDANLDRDGIALVVRLIREMSAAGAMVAVAAHTRELAEMDALHIDLRPVTKADASVSDVPEA